MDLSIIIPVYQSEKYIHICIESIYAQHLSEPNFEIILIDDGSTDNSIEAIKDIISQHTNIQIITQENQGVSTARNNGIAKASGDYILFMDSDDLLVDDSIPELLKIATDKKVDLVVADFLRMTDKEISQFHRYEKDIFKYEEKTGERLFLEDLNPNECFIWRTLFRREFLLKERISFFPIAVLEDAIFIHETYIKAQKCIRTPWIMYIYRTGHISATSSFNKEKLKDTCIAISKIWEMRTHKALSIQMQRKLEDDIYETFSFWFYAMLHSIKNPKERKELLDCLLGNVPHIEFKNSLKKRVETALLRYVPNFYLKIREWHWLWITRNNATI